MADMFEKQGGMGGFQSPGGRRYTAEGEWIPDEEYYETPDGDAWDEMSDEELLSSGASSEDDLDGGGPMMSRAEYFGEAADVADEDDDFEDWEEE